MLSEDDDEKATPPTSDTEKENAPYNKNGDDLKSLRISIENELRQEEAALQILQRLRDSQNPNNSRSSSKINAHTSNSSSNTHTNGNSSVQPTASPMLSAQKTPTAVQNPKGTTLFIGLLIFSSPTADGPAIQLSSTSTQNNETGSPSVLGTKLCNQENCFAEASRT